MMKHLPPDEIRLLGDKAVLLLRYGETEYRLCAEFLRVHSPSAQVRGHGQGNAVLQTGKFDVTINELVQAGNYALKICFSDGHDSGLYDWDYLFQLASHHEQLWAVYCNRLKAAGGLHLRQHPA